MESREDLKSILPYLPLKLESSTLAWPNQVIEALKSLSQGPSHSRVDSGEVLFLAISDLRNSLSLSPTVLAHSTADGYALFFDEFLSRAESAKWFGEVVPMMAALLLRFPTLLQSHYQYADIIMVGVDTGLRLLHSQQDGIVFLSQELIAALLSCSFFCLFPTANRGAKHLPVINFDNLFACLYENYRENLEHKIKCIIHYFERIHLCMPKGFVSFERKVLALEPSPSRVPYPTVDFWAHSVVPLCVFEICSSGLIEDQSKGALEVDFANKYLGGGALSRGCVQEEIRFMINPELIAGMLFLPSMSENEAIEIDGAERFSNYSGYASTFRHTGNHLDVRDVDSLGRRATKIVAIDALCSPGSRQFRVDCLLREVNKAFCGFLDQHKEQQYQILMQYHDFYRGQGDSMDIDISEAQITLIEHHGISLDTDEARASQSFGGELEVHRSDVGIATGNWGCGAFGGDPEVKTVIQWLAASQALRPFILYYTFGVQELHSLDQEKMALHYAATFQYSPLALYSLEQMRTLVPFMRREVRFSYSSSKHLVLPLLHGNFRRWRCGSTEKMKSDDEDGLMDEEERREWRKKIRDVVDNYPEIEEELNPEEKRRKMEKLLAEYPLVVEEDDPDWPEDADGRGFGLDQFFNKISIKNVKKDDDDENYDSDKEIVWQDDDYIRPIKDITTSDWEEVVFKDISPLIILVHNRYKRPKENERCRDELEKAVNIIWNCSLPSPRCVAMDANVDCDLVSALKVSIFPEFLFVKSGKIIYREKVTRPADELSKIMAFFYYGAAKPPCFEEMENIDEAIPSAPISTEC